MGINQSTANPRRRVVAIEEPPVARALFGSVKWARLWLIAFVINDQVKLLAYRIIDHGPLLRLPSVIGAGQLR